MGVPSCPEAGIPFIINSKTIYQEHIMFKLHRLLLIALLAGIFAPASAQQPSCRIIGTVTDIDDGSVIRLSTFAFNAKMLDSTVVKNGQFELTVPINETTAQNMLGLTYYKSQKDYATTQLFAEAGATLKVLLSRDYDKCSVTGSPLNFIQKVYNEKRKDFSARIIPLREAARDEKLSEAERQEKEKQANEEYKKMVEFEQDFAYQNIDNILGVRLITNSAPMMDKAFLAKAAKEIPERFCNNPEVVALKEGLATEARTAEGRPFVDLTMPDPKGKTVSLSTYIKKNKLTLVDFWASWCGPCRASIPDVKKLYEKYRKQGFGVVGVSFDSKKESWLKAIRDLALPWPQMSDLKGWQCAASPAYNIKAIPFTLLVDQQGTIVGRNIDDEAALVSKIEEILK